jgi:hypothetical protein
MTDKLNRIHDKLIEFGHEPHLLKNFAEFIQNVELPRLVTLEPCLKIIVVRDLFLNHERLRPNVRCDVPSEVESVTYLREKKRDVCFPLILRSRHENNESVLIKNEKKVSEDVEESENYVVDVLKFVNDSRL